MRAADLLRQFADILDQVEQEPASGELSPLGHSSEPNRFKQVMDLIAGEQPGEYVNEPHEKYASIDSVTVHAGGGVNGPKHPHDLRVKDPSAYPNQQEF